MKSRDLLTLFLVSACLFLSTPPAADACSAECICNAARSEACTSDCNDLDGELGVCFDANCGMIPMCCCRNPATGSMTCDNGDECAEQCGAPYEGSAEHWALYEYELDAERRIVGGEALYASSSSFAAAQLAQGSPNPAMPAGHYTVFTYQIDHAQNRPGSPNLRAFRKALERELEGSLPTEGQVAIRIAIDADGRIDGYDVLLSEPADLGDILAPHLHLYPAHAEQPAGKPIVDAVWMQVSQGQLGNFFQSGYVFERLR